MAEQAEMKPVRSPWSRDRVAEREEKWEALLHAAARAFAESGYYRTSLDEIAERLGVTKPTLYYYAKSKEELIAAVAARALDQALEPTSAGPDAPGIDALRAFLHRYAVTIANDFGRCFAVLSDTDLSAGPGLHLRQQKHLIDRHLRELVERGIADGSIGRCDVRLTAFMLAGAINGIARWYSDKGEMTADAVAMILVDQMTRGLAPR